MNNNLADIGAPPSMDQQATAPEPQGAPDEAHYRGAESRCFNCEFFRDPATCTKGVNGGTIEPEGGCDLFAMAAEGGDDEDHDDDDRDEEMQSPPGAMPE